MFSILFTEPAEEDLLATIQYISDVLKSPTAAQKLLDEIESKIAELKESPNIYPLVQDNYLSNNGIRMFIVENYLIFYIVNDSDRVVSIVRILYARRDWLHLLQNN